MKGRPTAIFMLETETKFQGLIPGGAGIFMDRQQSQACSLQHRGITVHTCPAAGAESAAFNLRSDIVEQVHLLIPSRELRRAGQKFFCRNLIFTGGNRGSRFQNAYVFFT
jgi:hypothetical protein